jgi:hypothetical protein
MSGYNCDGELKILILAPHENKIKSNGIVLKFTIIKPCELYTK